MCTRSFFGVVKYILDDLFDELESEGWEDVIRDRLNQLGKGYLSRAHGGPINYRYSEKATRFAYIYRYVAADAYGVFNRIGRYSILEDLFKKPSVQVSCLGGGPGSDLLGIQKFLASKGLQTQLTCYNYDRESGWQTAWNSLCRVLSSSLTYPSSYKFQQLDVMQQAYCSQYSDLYHSDLFTMSFFLSEFLQQLDDVTPFMSHLFEHAKSGACFLFIDNYRESVARWFDKCVGAYNRCYPRSPLRSGTYGQEAGCNNVCLPRPQEEDAAALGYYYKRLHLCRPQRAADLGIPRQHLKINYRIYCKQ